MISMQLVTPGMGGFAPVGDLRRRDCILLVMTMPRGRALVIARRLPL
jgi:hypothetical protein